MNLTLERVTCPLENFGLELDLQIEGRVTALFGPSGSGKTTILDLIAGLRMPATGRIGLGDRVLTDVDRGIRMLPRNRRIGYMVQEGALFPHLKVEGNLLYGLPRRGGSSGDAFKPEHVVDVLELAPLRDRSVARLSGGERQRVALGRALISQPELLLLDEPLGSLDQKLKARILPYLARVRDEFSIPMVVVTHAADEVMALCDHVVILQAGQVIGQGRPEVWFERESEPGWRLREQAGDGRLQA